MAEKTNDALVIVFDTEQESEAMVVQGLLDSVGIENLITSLDAPQDVLPVGGVVIQVAPDQADEARRIIEAYRSNPGSDDTAGDVSEEPMA
jgi:hypothetical protein